MLNVKKWFFFAVFPFLSFSGKSEKWTSIGVLDTASYNETNTVTRPGRYFWTQQKRFFNSDSPETTMNSSWPVPKQLPDLSVLLLAVIICVPEWILMPFRSNYSKHGTFFKASQRLVHFTPLCFASAVSAECRCCPLLQHHTTIINCVMHHISPM